MSEIEEKAVAMGWVPLEEWKGDPEQHRPADEFVARGEQILPIVKKTAERRDFSGQERTERRHQDAR